MQLACTVIILHADKCEKVHEVLAAAFSFLTPRWVGSAGAQWPVRLTWWALKHPQAQLALNNSNPRHRQDDFHNRVPGNEVNPTSRENSARVHRCCTRPMHDTWHPVCLPSPVTYWLYFKPVTLIELTLPSLSHRKGLQMHDQTHQYSRITILQAVYNTSSTSCLEILKQITLKFSSSSIITLKQRQIGAKIIQWTKAPFLHSTSSQLLKDQVVSCVIFKKFY